MCDHFVADGPERHVAAVLPQIEAAVRAEFAKKPTPASWIRRVILWFQLRREIHRRLEQVVSPKSLY
jgi:hypothetical protein